MSKELPRISLGFRNGPDWIPERELPVGPPGAMPLDFQPTLSGELLRLRPLSRSDYDALYAVAADPLVWEQHPIRNRHEPEIFRAFFEESMASGGALVALEADSQRMVGATRYHDYDEVAGAVEIGWTFLARSFWGGRYNGEIKRLMLQHAFKSVRSVIFRVGIDNVRSQRAVERIGAGRIGRCTDAGGRASILYEIKADDFAKRDPLPPS
jgi:RimJ/RimL family protein N-acetyltransferase